MLSSLRRWLKLSTDSSSPAGVVFVCSGDYDPVRLSNRCASIRDAFEQIGLRTHFVSSSTKAAGILEKKGIHVQPLRRLTLAPGQSCLVCSDRQFAIAPEVLQRLLDELEAGIRAIAGHGDANPRHPEAPPG